MSTDVLPGDLDILRLQLGRPLRGVRAVMRRCADGHPTVVETEPRLPDGTPFPTLYYLTCPVAIGDVSTLESRGLMKQMSLQLSEDTRLAEAYRAAHQSYLDARERIAHVPEIAGVSAGGMPGRVKCLHVLVAHSLAVGPGGNPLGDEALAMLAWSPQTCSWHPDQPGDAA